MVRALSYRIPDLIKKQREYRNRDLDVVGITYPPEKITEVRQFAWELKINYAVAIGSKETKEAFAPSDAATTDGHHRPGRKYPWNYRRHYVLK